MPNPSALTSGYFISLFETRSIQKYRSDVHTLRNSIEQVISDPDAYTYRKLADTVIRSLDSQDAELEQQS